MAENTTTPENQTGAGQNTAPETNTGQNGTQTDTKQEITSADILKEWDTHKQISTDLIALRGRYDSAISKVEAEAEKIVGEADKVIAKKDEALKAITAQQGNVGNAINTHRDNIIKQINAKKDEAITALNQNKESAKTELEKITPELKTQVSEAKTQLENFQQTTNTKLDLRREILTADLVKTIARNKDENGGVEPDFTSIQKALEYAYKFDGVGKYFVIFNVKAGFEWREQINIENFDASYIKIIFEDAQTKCYTSDLKVKNINGSGASYLYINNAKSPKFRMCLKAIMDESDKPYHKVQHKGFSQCMVNVNHGTFEFLHLDDKKPNGLLGNEVDLYEAGLVKDKHYSEVTINGKIKRFPYYGQENRFTTPYAFHRNLSIENHSCTKLEKAIFSNATFAALNIGVFSVALVDFNTISNSVCGIIVYNQSHALLSNSTFYGCNIGIRAGFNSYNNINTCNLHDCNNGILVRTSSLAYAYNVSFNNNATNQNLAFNTLSGDGSLITNKT